MAFWNPTTPRKLVRRFEIRELLFHVIQVFAIQAYFILSFMGDKGIFGYCILARAANFNAHTFKRSAMNASVVALQSLSIDVDGVRIFFLDKFGDLGLYPVGLQGIGSRSILPTVFFSALDEAEPFRHSREV
jgi:hypothetical protein